MRDRYLALIDRIITTTLKGEIRSKEQVYDLLKADIEVGTGEVFERCLQEQVEALQTTLAHETDEFKLAKATRKQRALKTIQGEWSRLQQDHQTSTQLSFWTHQLITAAPDDQLHQLLQALDPNQAHSLPRDQIRQLAQHLQAIPQNSSSVMDIAAGLMQGLNTWQHLEGHIVSWLYEQGTQSLGFGNTLTQQGPWSHWAKHTSHEPIKLILADLGQHQAITPEGIPVALNLPTWIELALILQRLQFGLVHWFDQQPYDPKAGKRLSIATYLTFAVVWSQLAHRLSQLAQPILAQGCFQMVLQGLYNFAQQDYFPLYGGLFALLSGESLQTLLDYLDQPLRQAPSTTAKARIFTLLGYSQRALGNPARALQFHQQALDIAREAHDIPCQIASLNHLSRTQVMQMDYADAIDMSQRALILARQAGDRAGEANALANLGYSEVAQAQDQVLEPEQYELTLSYLQQGLRLSEQVGDRPSQALCANSLGIALVMLGRYTDAIDALQRGLQMAQAIGDRALQGSNHTYLAAAYQGLGHIEPAILNGCLGMYIWHQLEAPQWRQPAGSLSILYGQLGSETFHTILGQYRAQLIAQIGVDGYDYLPKLIAEFRESLS